MLKGGEEGGAHSYGSGGPRTHLRPPAWAYIADPRRLLLGELPLSALFRSVLSVTSTDLSGTIEQIADPTKGGDLWNVRHSERP